MKGYIPMNDLNGTAIKRYIKYVKPEEVIEKEVERNYYDPVKVELDTRQYSQEQLIPEYVFTDEESEASSITEEQFAELQQIYPNLAKETEHRKKKEVKKEEKQESKKEDKKEEKKKD